MAEKCSSSGWIPTDRISSLPEPIISHILSFLPTKEAIATSILSKGWRFCWTRDASFDLDCRVKGHSAELIDAILGKQSGGSINKFLLRWNSPDAVFRWIGIAIARKLDRVRYGRDESICSLISGCPVLEYLGISRRAYVMDNMVVCSISSPVLKNLDIRFGITPPCNERWRYWELKIDCPSLESLRLNDTVSYHISIHPQPTSLKTVYLGGDFPNMNILAELMQACCYAKLLTLCLDLGPIESARLPLSFPRLAKLEIHSPKWIDSFIIRSSSLEYFLNGCSKLEELVIRDAWLWCQEDCTPRCMLPGIRRLRIKEFWCHEEQMEMLSFFLEHGLVMETVYISCFCDDEKRLQVVNQVSQFPRASATCQICLVDGRGRILNRF